MPIVYLNWITRDMLKENPDAIYVFGDNTVRGGFGGQAAAMRGEPNTIGVATKREPTMEKNAFFRDSSWVDRATLTNDLLKVDNALRDAKTVYVPKDGLGTGLSQLPTRAPRLYKMLWDFFAERSEGGCPWTTGTM